MLDEQEVVLFVGFGDLEEELGDFFSDYGIDKTHGLSPLVTSHLVCQFIEQLSVNTDFKSLKFVFEK